MKHRYKTFLVIFSIFILIAIPAGAEKISLKLSLNTNTITHDDIDSWIDSYNSLWLDWKDQNGGNVSGRFLSPTYGLSYEVELRVPVVYGFGILLGGTQLDTRADGSITYEVPSGDQTEVQSISNRIKALPLRIGLCFQYEVIPRLSLTASIGRHVVFVNYKIDEDYEAVFISQGQTFSYWYSKDTTFNSEDLGSFFSVGAEFELLKFLSLALETEQTWNTVDGFKGPYTLEDYLGQTEKGKASLYYYESKEFGLDKFYPVLAGHKQRPEGDTVRNIRQGELNFNGFSIKFGIRFKF